MNKISNFKYGVYTAVYVGDGVYLHYLCTSSTHSTHSTAGSVVAIIHVFENISVFCDFIWRSNQDLTNPQILIDYWI